MMVWLLAGILVALSASLIVQRVVARQLRQTEARVRRQRDRQFARSRRRHSSGFTEVIQTRRWLHVLTLTTDELVSADVRRRKVWTYLGFFTCVNVALRAQGRRS